MRRAFKLLLFSALLCAACGDDSGGDTPESWQIVHRGLPGALLSVWGSSKSDVWAVGGDADDGKGPTVLHFDGSEWQKLETGASGDLLWVFGFAGGPVYMGGDGGLILRYAVDGFTKMKTPSTTASVFGIWGPGPDEVWAVGGAIGGATGGFAWRLREEAWEAAPNFPDALASQGAIWKVFGRSSSDAWLVGTAGQAVRWNGATLSEESTGVSESLFTVHGNAQRFVAVGGFGTGSILENDGSGWKDHSPSGAPPLIGVFLGSESGYAVGQFGAVYTYTGGDWREVDTKLPLDESLHSVWMDETGGVWAVGGDVLTKPLIRGVMLHKGKPIPGAML